MFGCSRQSRVALARAKPSHAFLRTMCTLPEKGFNTTELGCVDAYRYTSGRWLYNESKRLAERYLSFNIPALVKAAAISIGRSDADVHSLCKLAEGGFNRTFELTMKDGMQLIARLPYPSTQPKRLAVASEVATMDLARSHGIPVPKIYDYSADAANPVGAEYIIMEKVGGQLLGDIWFTLSDEQRTKLLSEIADNEAKLFSIDFPAHGSIFYEKDLTHGTGRVSFESKGMAEPVCVGPDTSLKFWFEERSAVEISRSPSMTIEQVLHAAADKELAWLRTYGKPRLPFDRVHRDITNYQKSDPQEHVQNLERYKQIVPRLVPKETWLHRPTLRHPDLNPNNIFVSENLDIVGIIDWQHSHILPLALHASIPSHLQNYGDPDSEDLRKPELSAEIEEMDDEDRQKELELYRRRHLHFYYVGATATKNVSHFDALMHEGGLLLRNIFQHAGEPWEGNNVPLKADLISMMQHLSELAPCLTENDMSTRPCPFSFDGSEVDETMQALMQQEQADGQIEMLRNFIGIDSDGWVSHDQYEHAVAEATKMKTSAIQDADDDFERDMTIRHWPFDDHDENK